MDGTCRRRAADLDLLVQLEAPADQGPGRGRRCCECAHAGFTDVLQHTVSGVVPSMIVDLLEVVEIDDDDAGRQIGDADFDDFQAYQP